MTVLVWVLTPLAVLLLLLLFRFVGCDLILGLQHFDPYPGVKQPIVNDVPVAYWELHETNPPTDPNGGTAADYTNNHAGTYGVISGPFMDDPTHLSPAVPVVTLNLGITPGLQVLSPPSTCVEMDGGFVRAAYADALNPAAFTLEGLVLPQWDLVSPSARGRYRCVIESSNNPPAAAGSRKSRGFALYAGPDDPAQPNTPYRWQLWVGDGTQFRRLPQVDPANPGTLVTAEPTLLIARFDGTMFDLFVYTASSDISTVRNVLVSQPYVPNNNGDFTIGIASPGRTLVPPFPGGPQRIYPFHGQMEEIAVYDKALTAERIMTHVVSAFHMS